MPALPIMPSTASATSGTDSTRLRQWWRPRWSRCVGVVCGGWCVARAAQLAPHRATHAARRTLAEQHSVRPRAPGARSRCVPAHPSRIATLRISTTSSGCPTAIRYSSRSRYAGRPPMPCKNTMGTSSGTPAPATDSAACAYARARACVRVCACVCVCVCGQRQQRAVAQQASL
jgi:hypothetical protein